MGSGETQNMVLKSLLLLFLISSVATAQANRAAGTYIYNENRDEIVACDNCNVPRPVASLTKVMTALVALEHDSDLTKPIKIGEGSKIPPGITTRGDLFSALLVRSDNKAAEILAEQYPGGRKAFIRAMNARAKSLGLEFTKFVDPSGLSSGNVSKVGEIGTLIRVAALQPIIADTSVLQQVEVKNKKYKVLLDNTNKMLLADFNEIKFSKTGFTNASGWSVGMILERQGQRFVVVVLGAKNKAERYELAKKMIHKHFADIEHTVALEQKDISLWQRIIERVFGK
jgi:D-alanyl-D-alanine endopeptidase (penicillin-binding protein 7)